MDTQKTKPKKRTYVDDMEVLDRNLEAEAEAMLEVEAIAEAVPFRDTVNAALGRPTEAQQAVAATNAAAVIPHTDRILRLPVDDLVENPANLRKTYDGLDELAASMRRTGVLQALLVRPMGAKYQVVAGHRRLRAAVIAGLAELPCDVRELTDVQVVEAQIAENVQRAGLTPIEEAEALQVLREAHHYTGEQIAEKVGKSLAWVYARLKLTALGPEARKAVLRGHFPASAAVALARLPHALQAKFLADTHADTRTEPMTARDALEELQKEYTRNLKSAPFSLKDELLVPEAGSCAACPKNSKNSVPGLFDDLAQGQICTDTACYRQKCGAGWEKASKAKQEAGYVVLPVKEAEKLFSKWGDGGLNYNTGYVELSQPNHRDSKKRSWGQLLEEKCEPEERPEYVLAPDWEMRPHELVNEKKAMRALAKAGVKWAQEATTPKSKPAASAADKEAADAEEAERELEEKVALDACLAIGRALAKEAAKAPGVVQVLRELAERRLDIWQDGHLEALGVKVGGIAAAVAKADAQQLVAMVLVDVVSEEAGSTKWLRELATKTGVKYADLEKARRGAALAEAKKAPKK